MNDITVSLEMAKKLKEAGWIWDDAQFFWSTKTLESKVWECPHRSQYSLISNQTDIAAPTAEEILRELPIGSLAQMEEKERKRWTVSSPNIHGLPFPSLADSAASHWIHLKENNLLDPPNVTV